MTIMSANSGVFVLSGQSFASNQSQIWFEDLLRQSRWSPWLEMEHLQTPEGHGTHYKLSQEGMALHTPECNTLHLTLIEDLWQSVPEKALEAEILVGLLTSPYLQKFPNHDEVVSALRVRRFIAQAGQLTSLKFDTRAVDRPMSHWSYEEELGFTLRKGCSLIEALRLATQPSYSGAEYAFSCYRASEYVILLGIVEEAQISNPAFYKQLHQQWEKKAIASGAFHETFLVEHGSLDDPVPMRHYIPGDRVWFRNPDSLSSNVPGYEGSWVIYLGNGLFSNFWANHLPFSLDEKCLEVYHWRDGAFQDDAGIWNMDESVVSEKVRVSKSDAEKMTGILKQMYRYREPSGIYLQGGCIDASRESPRFIRPGTCDMVLRDV
jgi:Protein-glutamine gamma-glutamyltransferase